MKEGRKEGRLKGDKMRPTESHAKLATARHADAYKAKYVNENSYTLQKS